MKFSLFALSCLVAVNAIDIASQSHGIANADVGAITFAQASANEALIGKKKQNKSEKIKSLKNGKGKSAAANAGKAKARKVKTVKKSLKGAKAPATLKKKSGKKPGMNEAKP